MRKRVRGLVSLLLISTMLLSACGKKEPEQTQEPVTSNTEATTQKPKNEQSSEPTTGNFTTVSAIKQKYGSDGRNDFKPFYNVEQTTSFVFHFNSPVEPCSAVTVHTDPKCEVSSTVYQINDGYLRDNGGMDVVVKPGKPVLNAEAHAGGTLENYNWGYAPIYYLCIRYDRDAATPTPLAEPIIIPFTVRSAVSVPNLSYKINNEGVISLNWKPVEGAVKYNIYEANRVRETSAANGMTRAEAGFVGDHLNLLTTVSSADVADDGTFYFTDFHMDNTNNMLLDDNGYVLTQNFYELGSYYVTALDASGNESFFSMAVSGWKYESQLPNRFDSYETFFKNTNGNVSYLPTTVPVVMKDKSTAYFPINFKKGEEQYGSYKYDYTIPGTKLTGYVYYESATGEYPDEIISPATVNTDLYTPNRDVDIIPANTVPTFNDDLHEDSTIDLSREITLDESKKVPYDYDARLRRADIESARVVLDGVYPEGSDPSSITTYIEEGFDIGSGTQTTPTQPTTPNTPQTPDEPETTTPPADTPSSGDAPSTLPQKPEIPQGGQTTPEQPQEPTTPPQEPTTPPAQSTEPQTQDPGTTTEPGNTGDTGNASGADITPDNLVDEMEQAIDQQVQEANQTQVEDTGYPIFADSAEEEYLALKMVAREEMIDLSGFPSLQNTANLVDVWEKVIFQNPYIISNTEIGYNHESATLLCKYAFSKEETVRRQQEIKAKADSVASQIFNNSMTEEEKNFAIWDYLEANTRYDDAALEDAENTGFEGGINPQFADSFNTYGILVNNVGVCQSYAFVYKLLADYADIDCVMLTGFLNKNLPHAWNAVELDGTWYWVDVTNNKNIVQIPYMVFQSSSNYATGIDYVLDQSYDIDSNLSYVFSSDDSRDYYNKNGLVANSVQELIPLIVREYNQKASAGEFAVIKTTFEPTFDETLRSSLAQELFNNGITEEQLNRLKVGYFNSFFVLYE